MTRTTPKSGIDLSLFHSAGGTGLFERRNWVAYCTQEGQSMPERLTARQYRKLSTAAKADYNAQRLQWVSEWDFYVHHPVAIRIGLALNDALTETEFNKAGQGTVLGISGEFGAGKTSLALRMMRNKQRDFTEGVAAEDYIDHLPVVVGQAQVGGQYKPFIQELARFVHAPVSGREDYAESFNLFLNGVRDKGFRLLLIDEAQRMNLQDSKRRTGSGVIKDFMERFPNTVVVLVGSDLETTGPFGDDDGQQLAARGSIYTVPPFDHPAQHEHDNSDGASDGDEAETKETLPPWDAWLTKLGEHLPLTADTNPLADVSEVLWTRTGGLAGATARIVKTVTVRAIRQDEERITEDLLDSINIPEAIRLYAEARTSTHRTTKKSKGTSTKSGERNEPPWV